MIFVIALVGLQIIIIVFNFMQKLVAKVQVGICFKAILSIIVIIWHVKDGFNFRETVGGLKMQF